jgi:hypothetical protein
MEDFQGMLNLIATGAVMGATVFVMYYACKLLPVLYRKVRKITPPKYWWRNFKRYFVNRKLTAKRQRELLDIYGKRCAGLIETIKKEGKFTRREAKWMRKVVASAMKSVPFQSKKRFRIDLNGVKARIRLRRASGAHKPIPIPGPAVPQTTNGRVLDYKPNDVSAADASLDQALKAAQAKKAA